VLGVLQYVLARLTAAPTVESARKNRNFELATDSNVGCFINLHCGHNNPFSADERETLKGLLAKASRSTGNTVV